MKQPDRRAPIILSLGLAALLAAGSPVQAQGVCAAREALLERLRTDFHERPIAQGLEAGGHLVEILAAREGGSWTILLTRPDGLACVAAAGHHWQPVRPAPDSQGPRSGIPGSRVPGGGSQPG